jgi:hypothetical protein
MKNRWRGLVKLVQDAVDHGSRAVERVHLATTARQFAIVEAIPSVTPIAKVVHGIHDGGVAATYSAVRLVNLAVGTSADVVLEVLDEQRAAPST